MSRRLIQLHRLSWKDRFALAEAWARLLLIGFAPRVLPSYLADLPSSGRGRGEEGATEAEPRAKSRAETWSEIVRLHRLVAAAAHHHLYQARCLQRSLCLLAMLRRRGIEAELKIGVKTASLGPGKIEAHAWVEHRGEAIGEAESSGPGFAVLEAVAVGVSS